MEKAIFLLSFSLFIDHLRYKILSQYVSVMLLMTTIISRECNNLLILSINFNKLIFIVFMGVAIDKGFHPCYVKIDYRIHIDILIRENLSYQYCSYLLVGSFI